jgi:hypothetical protein
VVYLFRKKTIVETIAIDTPNRLNRIGSVPVEFSKPLEANVFAATKPFKTNIRMTDASPDFLLFCETLSLIAKPKNEGETRESW